MWLSMSTMLTCRHFQKPSLLRLEQFTLSIVLVPVIILRTFLLRNVFISAQCPRSIPFPIVLKNPKEVQAIGVVFTEVVTPEANRIMRVVLEERIVVIRGVHITGTPSTVTVAVNLILP